ncbi:MAG: DUF4190 domain-containing protein [Christensenellaceae bacterium]|nr:DUF4190 domain-containing protein [Christensenellaceae bacterium]
MKYCSKCGAANHDKTVVCPKCGHQIGTANISSSETKKNNGLAVSSLVLGIIGIISPYLIWLSLPCSILAVVFGVVANGRGQRSGMATAGFILGIISLVILSVIIVLAIAAIRVAFPPLW